MILYLQDFFPSKTLSLILRNAYFAQEYKDMMNRQ